MAKRICESLWLVGGADLTHSADCLVYALDLGELVLFDCGAGPGWCWIQDQIRIAGFDPERIHTLILTHGHLDHIGAAARVVADTGCRVVAHELDCEAIETGDPARTAASMYGMALEGCPVDFRVEGEEHTLEFSKGSLRLVHTPGHTPGSMVALVELEGERILFGQDIHGPFHPAFGSDIEKWRESMQRVLALEADVLCEGHYGVYRPASAVREFIEDHLSAHR
ncbi:MAG: MBL fold metallo-hydrolase [bacterium]